MKSFTFWIMIVLELVYCGAATNSILILEIEAYKGNHILEWGIAWGIVILLCFVCTLITWILCRVKKIEASEIKAYMQTGIAVSFGIVSALAVVIYIALEPWGGYFF